MEQMIALINALSALTEAVQKLSEKVTGEYLETFEKICDEQPVIQKQPDAEKTDYEPTFEHLRGLLAQKSREGHAEQVRALIQKYGVAKLSEIQEKDYAAVYAEAEVIGNA
ncbi:MAG: rRNA biogenesis protein rrp5 [Oscillospiraceae bacterium]|nr:rRNA biogenesis protein rrp5 [Oscillospiraceae bacterium]